MQNIILKKLIEEIMEINLSIASLRPLDANLNQTLQERLRLEWTYNSNAIEGNTLTFGETSFFLREGLTSEGKPLKDFLEAKNHAEAIDALETVIRKKPKLTEFFIKSLHGILLKGMEFTTAKGNNNQYIQKKLHVGEYKKQPNHVLTASGKIHHYCDPLKVSDEMQKLIAWFNSLETQKLSAVEKAGLLHYRFVSIHPFDDGNGRIARLLMNLTLMQDGFPPCIIKNKNRKEYLNTLEKVQTEKDENIFLIFIAKELKETMTFIQKILSKEEILLDPFETLNKTQRQDIIENAIGKSPLSIRQIIEKISSIKRETLKKDLKELCDTGKIAKKGKFKSVVYFKK
jgi:Fic family protein